MGIAIRYLTETEKQRFGGDCPIVLEREGAILSFYAEDELDEAIADAKHIRSHGEQILDRVSPVRRGAITGGEVLQ
jgi:hypothetical protein